MCSWTRSHLETLIELYKNQTVLYDAKHPLFRRRNAEKQALGNITKSLSEIMPGVTVLDVKTELISLRALFNTEIANMRDNPAGEWSSNLWCFEQLKFLAEHNNNEARKRNLEEEDNASVLKKRQMEADRGNELKSQVELELFGKFVESELKAMSSQTRRNACKEAILQLLEFAERWAE